eukprot:EG_transcript_14132
MHGPSAYLRPRRSLVSRRTTTAAALAAAVLAVGLPAAWLLRCLAVWVSGAVLMNCLAGVLALRVFRWCSSWQHPAIYVGSSPILRKAILGCPLLWSLYRPSLFFPSAKAQLFVQWVRNRMYDDWWLYFEEDPFHLPDGQLTSFMWLHDSIAPPNLTHRPIAVLFYGVTGLPGNLLPLARTIHRATGWRVAVFNRRGHVHPITVPSFNTVGSLADTAFAVERLQAQYPSCRLYGVGISAGAANLTKYCEDPALCRLSAAVGVSFSFDFRECIRAMDARVSRQLTDMMRRFFVHRNDALLRGSPLHSKLTAAQSLEQWTAHMHLATGDADEAEYYVSYHADLTTIRIPTLYINAFDDPVFPGSLTFPYRRLAEANPHLAFVQVQRGGHGTFLQGVADCWFARVAAQFLLRVEAAAPACAEAGPT